MFTNIRLSRTHRTRYANILWVMGMLPRGFRRLHVVHVVLAMAFTRFLAPPVQYKEIKTRAARPSDQATDLLSPSAAFHSSTLPTTSSSPAFEVAGFVPKNNAHACIAREESQVLPHESRAQESRQDLRRTEAYTRSHLICSSASWI
jgi:hypothetical protein